MIVISTANGLKFTEFKVAYHTRDAGRRDAAARQSAVELPNNYDAVRRAIDAAGGARERRLMEKAAMSAVAACAALEVWKFGGASLADAAGHPAGRRR